MLDQCHNIEEKIPGQIRSVLNVQEMTARALLLDTDALAAAQRSRRRAGRQRDLHGRVLHRRAPRPRRSGARRAACPRTRCAAYPASGYQEQIEAGPRRRHAGRMELSMNDHDQSRAVGRADRPVQPARGRTPSNTNYAGGNTSAKGTETDPVTGEAGRAALGQGLRRRPGHADRGRPGRAAAGPDAALVDVYPGVEREDEMVAAFDYCLHGKGGAAPSIDTAMHGLVDAAHVDHLHPDSGIAIATAADGEELTEKIFGDKVVVGAVAPPRLPARPGHRRDQGATTRRRSAASSAATASPRGATPSEECEANSLWIIDTAAAYIAEHSKAEPFGPRCSTATPRCRRPSGAPRPPRWRPTSAVDRLAGPADGRALHRRRRRCWTSSPAPSTRGWPRSAPPAPTTSCAPRSSRWSSTCPRTPPVEDCDRPAAGAARGLPRGLPGLLRPQRDTADSRRRCAAPTRSIVLVPGVGMFSFGKDKQTARVAGEFYVNAINVMRGAEGLSTLRPDRRGREVPHRVLGARGGQAAADAEAQAARHAGSRWSPARPPASARRSPPGSPPRARASSSPTWTWRRRRPRPRRSADTDVAVGVAGRRHRRGRRAGRGRRGRARVRRARPRGQQRRAVAVQAAAGDHRVADWDLQHDVMAKGSFLVSQAAAQGLIEQGLGGDIVYISSKNSVFAGPNNIAYSATKADQAHQVRLLAAELGEHGDPGQRHQPRRRGPGLRHLRRRLGRQARRRLRRGGGGPRAVLRPAHAAQARGASRARAPTRSSCSARRT